MAQPAQKPVYPADFLNAVRFSDIQTVKNLLARGADVNEKDGLGQTPLMYLAQRHDRLEIAQLLLDNGARIDETSNEGNSALILAAHVNNVKMVRLLLDNGASPGGRNKGGYSALSLARNWGFKEIAELIQKALEVRQQQAEEKARIDAAHAAALEKQKRLKDMRRKPSALKPV